MAGERSLGELFRDLTQDTGTLIRRELELAQIEMGRKLSIAGRQVAFIAAGGAVAYGGLLVILAALVLLGVSIGIAAWVAALVVGLLVLAVGGFLVQRGISTLRRIDPLPTVAVRTARESADWIGSRVP